MAYSTTGKNTNRAKPNVLIVDDQYRSFQTLPRFISPEEFAVTWVADEHQGLELLKTGPDKNWIVIVDLKSSGIGGAGFLHQARQVAPKAAIMVTSPLGPFLYKNGAFYEFSGPTLKQEINGILRDIAHRISVSSITKGNGDPSLERTQSFGEMIGKSEAINSIYRLIKDLEDSLATVLIQGESGTGKELIARMIHSSSPRRNKPFVAINCGAIPAALMESELFGHERGAFTGAVSQKKGKFEVARGGTFFLDEIGELDKELQVKLLRVLQEKEFQRVGGTTTIKADVRIIAATSQDLRKCVQSGEFREDLFYRLNVIPIYAPPLRERKDDIPLLLEHFLRKSAAALSRPLPEITIEGRDALINYSYPGNVRELANIVERLVVLGRNGRIRFEDLPLEVRQEASGRTASFDHLKDLPDEGVSLREIERELILKTLEKTSGNKQAAARMLGITRRLLYLRLAEYHIH